MNNAANKELNGAQATVRGLGVCSYGSLKSNVRAKLEDMLSRLDHDDVHTIGDNQMDVLHAMWAALGEVSNSR